MGSKGKKALSSILPRKCEICGWDKVTQRHRIKRGREGGEYRYDNVVILCPNHHALSDRGLDKPDDPRWLSAEELRAIVAARQEPDENES